MDAHRTQMQCVNFHHMEHRNQPATISAMIFSFHPFTVLGAILFHFCCAYVVLTGIYRSVCWCQQFSAHTHNGAWLLCSGGRFSVLIAFVVFPPNSKEIFRTSKCILDLISLSFCTPFSFLFLPFNWEVLQSNAPMKLINRSNVLNGRGHRITKKHFLLLVGDEEVHDVNHFDDVHKWN